MNMSALFTPQIRIPGNRVDFKVDCLKIPSTHSHRFKTFEDLASGL